MKKQRQQVLVIDDQEELVSILQVLFDADNIDLHQELTGGGGLERLKREKFDLLVLDLGLPDISGVEVLQAIKKDACLSRLSVIVLTGNNSINDKVHLFDLGATDYVTKPFHPTELRARVRAGLRTVGAEEEARSRSDFLAHMSHEIRNPMNGIIATAELLLETGLNEHQKQLVQTIGQSGRSCQRLVNDVLDFSRLESGKTVFDAEPFDLRICVETVFDLVAAVAAEKRIDLLVRFGLDVREAVIGDRKRLQQLLLNLVSNAVKFTQQGEVVVEVNRLTNWLHVPAPYRMDPATASTRSDSSSEHLLVTVRDTGIGISPDVQQTLFNSYVQAGSDIQRTYGGTGLGLAICRKIIEMLGGEIWVESAPGQGSAFSFYWPVIHPAGANVGTPDAGYDQEAACQEQGQDRVSLASRLHPGEKIVIIEDGSSSREYLADEVQRLRFEPVVFSNAGEAITWLSSHKAGAAIVDDHVCGGEGVITEMRRADGGEGLPVVLLTSINANPSHCTAAPPVVRVYKPLKKRSVCQGLELAMNPPSSPRSRLDQPAQAPPARLAERFPLKILLADDNEINRRLGLFLLQRLGYQADEAANGQEVLDALEQREYDLLLLDVRMPLMDGIEATRRIRQREDDQRPEPGRTRQPLVIIAMTANAMANDREFILSSGMDDYIAKPIEVKTFEAVMARWAPRACAHGEEASPSARSGAAPSVPRPEATPQGMPQLTPSPSQPSVAVELEPVVNMERFLELIGPGEDEAAEFAELYLGRTTELLGQLSEALSCGNFSDAVRLAHSGAGSSGTCGMPYLARIFKETERLSESRQKSEALEKLPGARRELEKVRRFLLSQKWN